MADSRSELFSKFAGVKRAKAVPKVGDRVMWNRNPNDAGTVTDVEGGDYIVRWDDGRETAIIAGSSQAERTLPVPSVK